MKLLIFSAIVLLLTACGTPASRELRVKALPVQAKLNGEVLYGPSALNDPNRFVWGASVLKGDDGRYHMLYSTWECGDSIPPFSTSWVLHSKIAYAVSDYPDRDFRFQKIVLRGAAADGDTSAWDAQMVHNPHLKEFGDKYYLYYIGSKDPGVQAPGSKGENVDLRNRVQQNQCIGVIGFNSFEDLMAGNFIRPKQPLLAPRTRVKPNNIVNPSPEGTAPKPDNIIVVNPSVVQRPSDGKYLLYFKGNFYNPHWRGAHGVAFADSPDGPFSVTDDFVFDIRNDDGSIASGEDPFVWWHPAHRCFYVVLKDFTGRITTGKPGLAILRSGDGIKWEKPANSFFMKKEVILASGDTLHVDRLERPQLLTAADGRPLVLYAACSVSPAGDKTDGSTCNIHIPLEAPE